LINPKYQYELLGNIFGIFLTDITNISMKGIFTTLAFICLILSHSFAKNYPADSLIRIKRDTIVKPERDSVIAPPEGWQNQKFTTKNIGSPNVNLLTANNAPTLVFPINYSSINGTSVGLYWSKNNSLGTCDYLVRVVDLTTLTPLYNYTNAGDNSSFGVQNLVAGRSYAISIRAVSKIDVNDFAESIVYNISVPSSNVATLGLTSINATPTFCGSNRTLTINYTRSGSINNSSSISTSSYYAFGNTFVELSDKNGSFANPILIGGVSLSTASGSFSVSLPSNLIFGTNYKIRLFSYSPVAMSGESVAMTIGTVADPDIWNRFNSPIRYNSLYLCTGSTATIKTALTDTTGMVFQWKKNGVNVVSGGNYSKYVVNQNGDYTISITQGACPTVTSLPTYVYSLTGSTTTGLNRSGDVIQCTGGSAILTMPYWSDNQTYQWQKNGQSISGANLRTYTATQTGIYSVRVVDGSCSITATSDALTFGSSIILTPSLGASTICSTGGQTFASVSPSYSPNLSNNYQWKRNGQNISGATSSGYTITQAGVYNAEVTQGGCTATSQGMEVKTSTTLDSIKIIQSPPGYCPSNYVNLNASSTGLGNVIYNWVKSGVTLSLSSGYTATSNGDYTLTVAQGSCVTTSKPVTVNLATDKYIPFLYLNGTSSSVMRDTVYVCPNNTNIPLYVNNYSSGSTFEWFKDGVIISSATTYYYYPSQRGTYYARVTNSSCVTNTKSIFVETTLPKFALNVTPQNPNTCANNIVKLDYYDKGLYPNFCTVWKKDGITINTCGSYSINVLESGVYTATTQQQTGCYTESEPVNIKIGEPITASVSGNTTMASGGTAKVYVNFTGSAPWTFSLSDGTTITTSKNPYIHTVTPSNTTTYTLTSVIGSCGAGTVSGSGVVTIGACVTPSIITTQPLAQTKCTGSSVTFSVVATGGGTLTYQWKKDGQNINGATNPSYTISNLKTADLGNYSVEVTGTCGTILSNNALLKPVNNIPAYASATNPVYVGSALRLSVGSYASNVTFAWQGPNGYTSSLQNPVIASAVASNGGVYTVSVDNGTRLRWTGSCLNKRA
jgi:trimeric autotransporter adhesin